MYALGVLLCMICTLRPMALAVAPMTTANAQIICNCNSTAFVPSGVKYTTTTRNPFRGTTPNPQGGSGPLTLPEQQALIKVARDAGVTFPNGCPTQEGFCNAGVAASFQNNVQPMCIKISQLRANNNGGSPVIGNSVRDCAMAPVKMKGKCVFVENNLYEICYCSTSHCNGAKTVQGLGLLTLLAKIALISICLNFWR